MAKFRVRNVFEVPVRRIIVLSGSIVEGEIRAGMTAHIPINSQFKLAGRVESIEFARRSDGEDVCLCFRAEPPLGDVWRGLAIDGEIIEVMMEACGN